MNRKNTRFNALGTLTVCVMGVLSAIMLLPFVWMLSLAFKSNTEIISGFSIIPHQWSSNGFRSVLEKGSMVLYWFRNSLIVTVSITALAVSTSAIAGYLFAKFQFKAKTAIFLLFLSGMMVPFQVTMIPVFLLMKELNLLNSIWALILPAIVSPFGIFLSRQFIEVVPTEVMEAARIDGAGEYRTFFRIIIPQILPILSALSVFLFIQYWNDYLWPLIILNEQKKMTLSLGLQYFGNMNATDYAGTMFMALIIMAPIIILFLCFQKQFIKGITLTGMK
ncbi:carbohydrate ABC transporter permease [Paenibacillus sepulcri]|uniref:Carbohydrate ABC transporter permease n=1 Tax=Paenibacillus sepulcri TaxID=359917 RepID=A0ABS7C3D9_9BACL|nr:carbohydrate ABC transporter permease [Paenibacillus sepulcri]